MIPELHVWTAAVERSACTLAVAPFQCLAAMLPEGSTRAGIMPGCPSLDRGGRIRTTDLPVSKFALHLLGPPRPLNNIGSCFLMLHCGRPQLSSCPDVSDLTVSQLPMNRTYTNKLRPHQPSRSAVSRVALLAAYSRVGKRKQFSSKTSLLSLSHTFTSNICASSGADSLRHFEINVQTSASCPSECFQSSHSETSGTTSCSCSHTEFAWNRLSYVSESIIQDVITAAAAGCGEFGIILSHQIEGYVLDYIRVDSRLYAVRLATSLKVSQVGY
ncbi:hypothetical protein T265_04218 [Opisthorchis viverrini]|uniref:Uncharacterized protein n=1 Tax=Opisthorchis viverrini TaxID=6198 RepID=A0A075AGT0_OPIVI|nr:hypothetical protein T265_04218 [Opisthorchis viverrini]KER29029.1 hypothetical protein T265_04218 [Opisthorchis viverrini]